MTDSIAVTDWASVSTADLESRLAKSLRLTVDAIAETGEIWAELRRRRPDYPAPGTGLGRLLPLIASGELAPEAVVAFLGRLGLLLAMAGVPLHRQRELAAGSVVRAVDVDGAIVTTSLDRLPHACVSRLFSRGTELTTDEQRLAFRSRSTREKSRKYKVKINRHERTLSIGRSTVSIDEVRAAMSEAAGRTGSIDPVRHSETSGKTAVARLTDDERDRLHAAVKAAGIDEGEWMRQAVLAWL